MPFQTGFCGVLFFGFLLGSAIAPGYKLGGCPQFVESKGNPVFEVGLLRKLGRRRLHPALIPVAGLPVFRRILLATRLARDRTFACRCLFMTLEDCRTFHKGTCYQKERR